MYLFLNYKHPSDAGRIDAQNIINFTENHGLNKSACSWITGDNILTAEPTPLQVTVPSPCVTVKFPATRPFAAAVSSEGTRSAAKTSTRLHPTQEKMGPTHDIKSGPLHAQRASQNIDIPIHDPLRAEKHRILIINIPISPISEKRNPPPNISKV